MIWPWSRIRQLETALENAVRDNRILERRCDWYEGDRSKTMRHYDQALKQLAEVREAYRKKVQEK